MEILNLIATLTLAFCAVFVAIKANVISTRSVQLEADKHIFEWGQRCLNCLSRISSLRLIPNGQIDDDEFRNERRLLRAELYALQEEGALFFEKAEESGIEPSLQALQEINRCLDGRKFEPPKPDDYDSKRKVQNNEIRKQSRLFIAAIQNRVGNEWSRRP